jgi:ABC-2 type transport system permease protein
LYFACLGVYIYAADYRAEKTVFHPAAGIEFINWHAAEYGWVSGNDPQIIIPGTGKFGRIDYVTINGTIAGDLAPQVYYAVFGGGFTERSSLYPAYEHRDGLLTVHVGKTASRLRVDPGHYEGITLSAVSGVTIRYSVIVDAVSLAAAAFIIAALMFACYAAYVIRKTNATYKTNIIYAYLVVFGKYKYLLYNLVRKDITVKYRRSALGILWSVLNPLLMMIVITSVFRNIFRIQIENFPIYYLTGSLIFNFMGEATSLSMMSVIGAGGLLRKVYIPKYIFPLEKCLFALINGMFSFVAVLVMIPILGAPVSWTIVLFWVPFVFVLVFSFGVGLILSSMTVFFRDITHLYSVFLMAWMYLTPIIYPLEILPVSMLPLAKANPMFHYVAYFREIVMYGRIPGLAETLACAVPSVLFLAVGILIFKKTQDRFILFM